MTYKDIIFVDLKGFSGKELINLKKLSNNFLKSQSNKEYGIVSSAIKYTSKLTKLYKVKLAIFYETANKKFCSIKNTYTITDLNNNILLVFPTISISPKKHPVNIHSGEFLCYDKFGLCDIPLETLTDLSYLKEKIKKENEKFLNENQTSIYKY